MGGVFGERVVRSTVAVLAALGLSACSAAEEPEAVGGSGMPDSIDGLWIVEDTDLNLDIELETASVDGRTGCSRLLGSLTFIDGGATTSFSLPGREDRSCSSTEARRTNQLVSLLESVERAEAEPGAFRLFDGSDRLVGRLIAGS